MKTKKIPKRMCNGCMTMKPKKELIRVVKNKENQIFIDETGKKPGRGAYICKDIECLQKAIKSKRIEKSLGVKISESIYNELKEKISNLE